MAVRSIQHTLKVLFHQTSLPIERAGDATPHRLVPAELPDGNVVYLCVLRLPDRDRPQALQSPSACRRVEPLQKWRLKRVFEYVDNHLGDRIRLADIAAAAGLTRMHFAAQFRSATGRRPHQYVLERRIDRARELLRDTHLPLVEVALSVGFQTQSHFTTVFSRLAGKSPSRWRRMAQDWAAVAGPSASGIERQDVDMKPHGEEQERLAARA